MNLWEQREAVEKFLTKLQGKEHKLINELYCRQLIIGSMHEGGCWHEVNEEIYRKPPREADPVPPDESNGILGVLDVAYKARQQAEADAKHEALKSSLRRLIDREDDAVRSKKEESSPVQTPGCFCIPRSSAHS